jgi:hypothetical protein
LESRFSNAAPQHWKTVLYADGQYLILCSEKQNRRPLGGGKWVFFDFRFCFYVPRAAARSEIFFAYFLL